jgi:hypothetical protein
MFVKKPEHSVNDRPPAIPDKIEHVGDLKIAHALHEPCEQNHAHEDSTRARPTRRSVANRRAELHHDEGHAENDSGQRHHSGRRCRQKRLRRGDGNIEGK